MALVDTSTLPTGTTVATTLRIDGANADGTVMATPVDDTGAATGPAVPAPSQATVVAQPVAVGDLLQSQGDGTTYMVRWVDPADATRWAAATNQRETWTSAGYTKVGTGTLA